LPASTTINTVSAGRRENVARAILWGGFACGVLDITAAFLVYGLFGARPVRILQGIASGLLGARSFDGGFATAALGLFLHFFIAMSAATVFVLASRRLKFLVQHPIVSGVLYGIVVYFFMQGVVRISAARHGAFSWKMTLIGIAIHIVCVGTPISQATYRFARD
jgi:hypothetical protein